MRLAAVVAEKTPFNARLQASVALRGDAAMDAAAARFRWPAGVERRDAVHVAILGHHYQLGDVARRAVALLAREHPQAEAENARMSAGGRWLPEQ